MKKISFAIGIGLTSFMVSSCLVPKTKLDASEAGRFAALFSCDSLRNLLSESRERCAGLVTDTTNLGSNLRNAVAMLNTNQAENQKLSMQLALKKQQLDDREATIAQMQLLINEQNRKVQSLLDNVKNALLGFNNEDLTIREEGGKVYVAMSDKLLFESGSAVVNELGQNALGKLAEVLNRQTDIDVYIEGHTDSVPIKTLVFKDNWDLSVIRATSVVRILSENYGVNPLQIQPCGRGEHKPIDTNATAEGRARNRRTEIIMAPRLDKLFEMLK
ncbi:MAG: OmpA family protein [Bacteroidales bacterium]|nr:OmpA family protein [Candidatus Physcousia equi]